MAIVVRARHVAGPTVSRDITAAQISPANLDGIRRVTVHVTNFGRKTVDYRVVAAVESWDGATIYQYVTLTIDALAAFTSERATATVRDIPDLVMVRIHEIHRHAVPSTP